MLELPTTASPQEDKMAHMLTIKDLEERLDGTYYTGPLEEAKAFIRKECFVTEATYVREGKDKVAVLLGLNGDFVTWDNCNDYGVGDTSEEAWRYALGGEFGPANDEFSAFPLTHNHAEAVRALVAYHFPEDQRLDVFYSTTGPHAVVADKDGDLWQVFPDGTLKHYRS
ncbi:Hypothetical Protein OBI_RACECAR_305 [Arthrobacter phage Racecar]|nr:hypothetical protein PBI_RACECAR_97 [Arthrobacter phage Racecar]QFG12775.1 hypothetical protein PBI_MIMI_95 [Arthrobacter phage Mimi]